MVNLFCFIGLQSYKDHVASFKYDFNETKTQRKQLNRKEKNNKLPE